jgi:hypothetical protein
MVPAPSFSEPFHSADELRIAMVSSSGFCLSARPVDRAGEDPFPADLEIGVGFHKIAPLTLYHVTDGWSNRFMRPHRRGGAAPRDRQSLSAGHSDPMQ